MWEEIQYNVCITLKYIFVSLLLQSTPPSHPIRILQPSLFLFVYSRLLMLNVERAFPFSHINEANEFNEFTLFRIHNKKCICFSHPWLGLLIYTILNHFDSWFVCKLENVKFIWHAKLHTRWMRKNIKLRQQVQYVAWIWECLYEQKTPLRN